MYKVIRLITIILLVSFAFSASLVETGFLRSKNGQPVNAKVLMQFSIFNTPLGGTALWTSQFTYVSVNNGLYSVELGVSSNPIDEGILAPSRDAYLQSSVEGDVFYQRELIGASPRAIVSAMSISSNHSDSARKLDNMNISQFINDLSFVSQVAIISTSNYSVTANVALIAKYVDWENVGNKESVVTTGMLAEHPATANYALIANTANVVSWGGVKGLPTTLAGYGISDVASQIVNTANYALTASKLSAMNISQFSNDALYLTSVEAVTTVNYAATSNFANIANTANAVAWSGVKGLPTTLAGYGISDVAIQIVNTANVALVANYIDWGNVGNKGSVVTTGMLVEQPATANYANKANTANALENRNISQFSNDAGYLTSVETVITVNFATTANYANSATTANVALAANYIEWENIGNRPSVVSTGMVIDQAASANYAKTANYALTANYAKTFAINVVTDNYNFGVSINGDLRISGTVSASALQVNGSIASKIDAKTADYTLTAADSNILASASVANVKISLPDAVQCAGRKYNVKKGDNTEFNVEIGAYNAQTIDEYSHVLLFARGQFISVVSDGANWQIYNN